MATYAEYKNALYADRKLTSTQKAVASCIAHHADWKTGQHSHPGNDRIAEETGYSKRSVISAVAELINQGWLVQTYDGRGRNSTKASEYSLSIPGMMTVVQSATDASQSATDDTSKCSTFTTSTSELPLEQLPSGKEDRRGEKKRRTPASSTPAPRTAKSSSATARSAHSGQDAYPSSAPESARTYTYWESSSVPGAWYVFPIEKALRAPKSAAAVTLSVEEDEFYREFFRGGKELNRSRMEFLVLSQEERASTIKYVRDHWDEARPMRDDEYSLAA